MEVEEGFKSVQQSVFGVVFFSFALFFLSVAPFLADMGRRRSGSPARAEQVGLERDLDICKSSPPLPWPFGPHIAGYQIKGKNKPDLTFHMPGALKQALGIFRQ